MNQPVIIIGIGELGGIFARALLRRGHPVFPIVRGMNMAEEFKMIPAPALVLVAVGENDLHATLDQIPEAWRDNLCLLQNELLPRDWRTRTSQDPTVIATWFEKKRGQDVKVLLPSPVHGPHAALIRSALETVDIPARTLTNRDELLYELVRKNVYILTINIAGLVCGGTVAELWRNHQTLTCEVANEIIGIQELLAGAALPRDRLIEGMLEAFAGDPEHKCLGRTARSRLQRALGHAEEMGLAVPALRKIHQDSWQQ